MPYFKNRTDAALYVFDQALALKPGYPLITTITPVTSEGFSVSTVIGELWADIDARAVQSCLNLPMNI